MRLEANGHGQNVRLSERDELFSQGEPVTVADIKDSIVIKEGTLFMMADREGNLPPGEDQGYGLYKGAAR